MATQTGKHAGGRPSLGLRAFLGIRIPLGLLQEIDEARVVEDKSRSRSAFCAELFRKALRRKA